MTIVDDYYMALEDCHTSLLTLLSTCPRSTPHSVSKLPSKISSIFADFCDRFAGHSWFHGFPCHYKSATYGRSTVFHMLAAKGCPAFFNEPDEPEEGDLLAGLELLPGATFGAIVRSVRLFLPPKWEGGGGGQGGGGRDVAASLRFPLQPFPPEFDWLGEGDSGGWTVVHHLAVKGNFR